MTVFPVLLALAAFSVVNVESQEYDLFDSAKLEADEFVEDLFDNHLEQFLPGAETELREFSCHIKKDLLYGFITTHRDIQATFDHGFVKGLANITKLQCRPVMGGSDGQLSMVCLIQLDKINIQYSGTVTGFDLRGSKAQTTLTTKAKHVLTVSFSQKAPAPPKVDEITSLIARNIDLDYGNFGFNRARQYRLRSCVDSSVRARLLEAINTHIKPAIEKALLANNRDLPEARLDQSNFSGQNERNSD